MGYEAWVLYFGKSTCIGYVLGIGTSWICLDTYSFIEKKLGINFGLSRYRKGKLH